MHLSLICRGSAKLAGLVGLSLLLSFLASSVGISAEPVPVSSANFKLAARFSTANLKSLVFDQAVRPMWIGKTDTFWYSFRTSQGTAYYLVDPAHASKQPLFDRSKLAMQLSELTRKPMDEAAITLAVPIMNDDGTKLKFNFEESQYEFDLKSEKLVKVGKAQAAPFDPTRGPGQGGGRGRRGVSSGDEGFVEEETVDEAEDLLHSYPQSTPPGRRGAGASATAPDGKASVFAKKFNLYFVEGTKDADAVQLTKDGVEDYSFGGTGEDKKATATVNWSTDSKSFYVTRSDARNVKELFLVNSLANPRPALEKYKYAMPGEEAVRRTELYVFDREKKKLSLMAPKWKDETYTFLHWSKTGTELRFVRNDRLRRNIEFCAINPFTLECKCLVSEGFENAPIDYHDAVYLDDSDEIIWWSERSGWAHFYLCDRNGKIKNAITSGAFRASSIVQVDAKNRLLYFHGNGREKGENVYYEHLYSVHFDGSGLTLLDPGNGFHTPSLSPTRQYLVDNCSRVDRMPTSTLRDSTGKVVLELEHADLSRLVQTGWKMPETFMVKAADGVTDLYGNMWKPFDFDPKKKYPIVAHVYPGPQTEGVIYTFSPTNVNQQIAQLGIIVIQVGHRGGAPTRSKAYASFGYGNLRDYGLADKKSSIEQLAARYPFIDIERVGIYGHSGGGFMSAAALLQKPYNDFFKVAVASSGNHDNNIYNDSWSERYHGLKEIVVKKEKEMTKVDDKGATPATKGTTPAEERRFEIKVPTNAELAANLKGHLLLVHGDMDNNVHPANTIRLADALIKANKRFDMLILPGKRHAFGDYQPYFTERMMDFFAEHLLNFRRGNADLGAGAEEEAPKQP